MNSMRFLSLFLSVIWVHSSFDLNSDSCKCFHSDNLQHSLLSILQQLNWDEEDWWYNLNLFWRDTVKCECIEIDNEMLKELSMRDCDKNQWYQPEECPWIDDSFSIWWSTDSFRARMKMYPIEYFIICLNRDRMICRCWISDTDERMRINTRSVDESLSWGNWR